MQIWLRCLDYLPKECLELDSVLDSIAVQMQRPEPDSDDSTSEVEEQQANRGADSVMTLYQHCD